MMPFIAFHVTAIICAVHVGMFAKTGKAHWIGWAVWSGFMSLSFLLISLQERRK